jgi:hypothetical protein
MYADSEGTVPITFCSIGPFSLGPRESKYIGRFRIFIRDFASRCFNFTRGA